MAKTIKNKKVNKLNNEEFKRVTGVTRETFKLMVKTVIKYYKGKKAKGGRKSDHTPSDQVLMMLEYYREYRTFKSIGVDYNTSESTAHYVVTKIENILIKDERFHISSLKKQREINEEKEEEVIIVDVTKSPCERPKKTKKILFRKKEKRYYKNTNHS